MVRIVNGDVTVEPIGSLKPHPDNPNVGALEEIRESIRVNGFYGYVVARLETREILAGNHRWMAAQAEGLETVPVFWLDVDDIQARKIVAVDNRAAEDSGVDLVRLKDVLEAIGDTEGTGYPSGTLKEVVALLNKREPGGDGEPEDKPDLETWSARVPPDLVDSFWALVGEATEEDDDEAARVTKFLEKLGA